ncbi:MAG: cobalamin biosynthesis protein CobD [Firmicutes bacterium]|nr:cobalamin biosynthesis protein CobD [Bacillota bacterium]
MLIIILAFLIDALLGDPDWLPHPVVQMGRLIIWTEKRLYAKTKSDCRQIIAGFLLVCFVLLTTFALTWGVLFLCQRVHKIFGFVVAIILLSTTFAARGLQEAAERVLVPLKAGNLPAARQAVAMIVGRDTENMSTGEVVRATIETVAENTIDGVTAPLFYALLGGVPLAMLYKAINTMDSMLGYKNERYLYFGRVAAKLDDLANWLPARLTAPAMILAAFFLRYDAKAALQAMRRDSRLHASPNSGFAEATTAGALNIVLGGASSYFGRVSERPRLWPEGCPPQVLDIEKTIKLMRATSVIFLICGLAVRALIIFCLSLNR